jgi:adenylate cyclase
MRFSVHTAVDAVQCAVDAQTALVDANASLAPDRRISFRMGVHIGDVMVRGGDLITAKTIVRVSGR